MWFQYKFFKKPGHMGQVPLSGADIRHGLDDEVFRFQVTTEFQRRTAHTLKVANQ
jgi:hypothetical protein